MKKAIIILLLTIANRTAHAQCKSGNCVTGTGTYNFGWCLYTGEFKNGRPEGSGTMKYDDYTYIGHFTNGLEDGAGTITKKDGTRENVTYTNGVKEVSQLIGIAASDYKPLDVQNANCISGNCNTGYGTFQFSSGNKYTGNFKDHRFEGEGVFLFANGDKFEGTFHNNEKASGTYQYYTKATYTGNYDSQGMEYNGVITSPQGFKISYVNGKAIIPPPQQPRIPLGYDLRGEPAKSTASTERIKMTCSVCYGAGVQRHVEDWSGPTTTHLVSVSTPCWKCHGSGVE
jgi:hypothetical protein